MRSESTTATAPKLSKAASKDEPTFSSQAFEFCPAAMCPASHLQGVQRFMRENSRCFFGATNNNLVAAFTPEYPLYPELRSSHCCLSPCFENNPQFPTTRLSAFVHPSEIMCKLSYFSFYRKICSQDQAEAYKLLKCRAISKRWFSASWPRFSLVLPST